MSDTIPTQIRIDTNLKTQANELFGELGLDLSSAVNIFLRQCVLRRGLPFTIELPTRQCFSMPKTQKVEKFKKPTLQGWTKDIFDCIERIPRTNFKAQDVYRFESELAHKYPENRAIRPTILKELQKLRDLGYIAFITRGHYRKTFKLATK